MFYDRSASCIETSSRGQQDVLWSKCNLYRTVFPSSGRCFMIEVRIVLNCPPEVTEMFYDRSSTSIDLSSRGLEDVLWSKCNFYRTVFPRSGRCFMIDVRLVLNCVPAITEMFYDRNATCIELPCIFLVQFAQVYSQYLR